MFSGTVAAPSSRCAARDNTINYVSVSLIERFSWVADLRVVSFGRGVESNLVSYATRHEAEAAGRRVMNNLADSWRKAKK